MIDRSLPEIGRQGARFAMVGAAATATHLALAGIAIWLLPDLNQYAANLTGFAAALWVSYFGHTHITFGKSGSFLRLLIVSCGGFIANNAILTALNATGFLSGYPAIVVAVTVVPAGVFLANKYWVFIGMAKTKDCYNGVSSHE